jgi:deoxycytidylate deaminase
MDIKKYGKEVIEYIKSLSDEEFSQLLIEAGIEKCPYEKTDTKEYDKVMERLYNQEIVDIDNAINTLKRTVNKEELEEKYSKFISK